MGAGAVSALTPVSSQAAEGLPFWPAGLLVILSAMMKATGAALLALTASLAGCAPPPVRQNAWTSAVPAAASPYADATVAVVYSENTKSALEYLRRSTFGQFDPDAVFGDV